MEQYIDKDAVVAKIENRIKELQNLHKESEEKLDSIQKTAILLCIDECKVILSLVDTLEVKEVDLNKEIDRELETRWRGEYLYIQKFRESAKHFFELGLKAHKGEKV